jgi:aldehyde dehydrogenase (NAD+)
MSLVKETHKLLKKLGVAEASYTKGTMPAYSPVTGEKTADLKTTTAAQAGKAIDLADQAFKSWRLVPAPRRGELVRLLGEELRAAKADLGRLVSIEAGKIPSEGLGEVQEMIDICDLRSASRASSTA